VPFLKVIKDIVRRQFLSGVLVVVPLILTYVVLRFLFTAIDGILSPILLKAFGYTIPGLGIITTVLIILLTGFFVRSLVGRTVYKYGDKILARTPLIRIVYLAAKQVIQALTIPHSKTFKEVVLVEHPRRGLYALGFATTKIKSARESEGESNLVGVFIASTPTPISGFLVFVPQDDMIPLDMTVEEAIKLLVSGGIVSPKSFKKGKLTSLDGLESRDEISQYVEY